MKNNSYTESIQKRLSHQEKSWEWEDVADLGQVFLMTGKWPAIQELLPPAGEPVLELEWQQWDSNYKEGIGNLESFLSLLQEIFPLMEEHLKKGCPMVAERATQREIAEKERREAEALCGEELSWFGGEEEEECVCESAYWETRVVLEWLLQFDGLILAAEHFSFPLPEGFREQWEKTIAGVDPKIFKHHVDAWKKWRESYRWKFFSPAVRELIIRMRKEAARG
jgi:hypothetical protein